MTRPYSKTKIQKQLIENNPDGSIFNNSLDKTEALSGEHLSMLRGEGTRGYLVSSLKNLSLVDKHVLKCMTPK